MASHQDEARDARPPAEPTPDQLRAMAYADGELPTEERAAFEARLASEPALGREVAQYRRLELLSRHLAPPEPAELEWERLRDDPVHRAGLSGGFVLLAGATALLLCWSIWVLVTTTAIPLVAKITVGAAVGGVGTLFLTVLRARLRLLPHDPYTAVKR